MAVKRCGTLSLKEGQQWRYPYSCRTSARMATQLLTHNVRAIPRRVLSSLRIDLKTRRKTNNRIVSKEGKETSREEYSRINKGLAMELLSSCLLTCLDDPSDVLSRCVLSDNGDPKTFAQGGKRGCDVLATYGEDFRIVAEVSAKRETAPDFFEDQVSRAIDHAKDEWETDNTSPIYVLVVNGCSIEQGKAYRDVYNALEPTARAIGDIRVVPIWGPDFAELVSHLSEHSRRVGLDFGRRMFTGALNRIYERIAFDEEPVEPSWTRSAFIEVIEGDSTLDLELGTADENEATDDWEP